MNTRIRTCCRTAATLGALAATAWATPLPMVAAALPEVEVSQPQPPQGSPEGRRGGERREPDATDRQTRMLPLGPAGFLELRNVSGDITITAGGGREVQLEIVRTAYARSVEEAQRLLASVTVAVDQQGERASVTAEHPRRPNGRVSVAYLVTAPAGTRISAKSVSGNLVVRNIKGEISASLVSGSMTISRAERLSTVRTISGDITLTNLANKSGITVSTVSGRILVADSSVTRLDVDSVSGSVTARSVSSDRAAVRSLSGAVEFAGALAKGGRYEFQSHSGDLRLVTSGAGFVLEASTFSGSIRPDAGVALKNVSAAPRSLRGTVGDGSATVVVTTFSGGVTIGRK
jgi:hypothetical protein